MIYTQQYQQWLKANNYTAIILARGDRYLGEYVAPCDEYLTFAVGFSGSAGYAVITQTNAYLFIDGRYTIQAAQECPSNITIFGPNDLGVNEWLLANAPNWANGRVAFDGGVVSHQFAQNLRQNPHIQLESVANPIFEFMTGPVERPAEPIFALDIQYAGVSSHEKRHNIAQQLQQQGLAGFLFCMSDSLCWLLNCRGADVPYNPVIHGYVFLHQNGQVDIFCDKPERFKGLVDNGTAHQFTQWGEFLGKIIQTNAKIGLDKGRTPDNIISNIEKMGGNAIFILDPTVKPKSLKNAVEQQGTRNAHIRDGVAMVKFLFWLEKNYHHNSISELDINDKLYAFRAENDLFMGNSFPTIASTGPNSAINHYRPQQHTNLTLCDDHVFLLDSGGQYYDGTTDITRTIFMPNALHHARMVAYTAVLRGHINLAMARFPAGITGHQLDSLARAPLWEQGLDFQHGTGHGVGVFLNVHEGPQRISPAFNNVPLEPGMLTSNEPGYYVAGDYGIRIESLILCVEVAPGLLGFDTITFCPIDTKPIIKSQMRPDEIAWFNHYHQQVYNIIAPLLSDNAIKDWLKNATKPI